MIRAIQIGTTTVQGRVIATYPDPSGEHGTILSQGRVIMGRLIPQHRGGALHVGIRPDAHGNKGVGGGALAESNIKEFDSAQEVV